MITDMIPSHVAASIKHRMSRSSLLPASSPATTAVAGCTVAAGQQTSARANVGVVDPLPDLAILAKEEAEGEAAMGCVRAGPEKGMLSLPLGPTGGGQLVFQQWHPAVSILFAGEKGGGEKGRSKCRLLLHYF